MLPRPFAHVDYVTHPEASSDPVGFMLGALGLPGALLVIVMGAAVVLAAVLAWARWRPLEEAPLRVLERMGDRLRAAR